MLHKKILVITLAVVILALPVTTLIFMPRETPAFSENENRFLMPFISPDYKNVMNRRFMTAFDEWFADRFTLRENWIIIQNEFERFQGKTEINGVFTIGANPFAGERLIQAFRGQPNETTDAVLAAVDSFAGQAYDLYGIDSYIMLIPTAQEIYKDMLPPNSQPGNQSALINYCYDNLENLTPIDAATYLSENSGGYIYYRTDHHWTTFGAYWGYYAAANKLGLIPHSIGMFNIEHVSSDFRGTLFSMTLDYRITPDVISLYTLAGNPPQVSLSVDTGREIIIRDSLYLREYLDKKDKYSVFLGQNAPIIKITTDVDNDKSLLMFKDSFAHSMLPFLANHYSRITVLDMRHLSGDIHTIVNVSDYEQILFVYDATNFMSDRNLRKLFVNSN
jgi:hypothetical protein